MSKLDKITEKVMKFAQLKYVKIIMNSFMSIAAFSIGASLFTLIKSIPIPFWQTFMTTSGLGNILSIPVNMVSNLYAVMVVICVGYETAKAFDEKPLPVAMTAFGAFMIMTPFAANVAINVGGETVRGVAENVISVSVLGSQGIFLAMFTGLLSARIYIYLSKKNIKLKMPDSLPPAVAGMFETMIPAGLTFVVFIIIRVIFENTPFATAQSFIYGVLQKPLMNIGANPIGASLYLAAGKLLWLFGIHGDMLAYATLGSIRTAATQANMAAFASGTAVPYLEWGLLTPMTNVHIFALAILLMISKSAQHKSLGKLSIVTSFFNITEPIMFGLPIILNPVFAVPFVLLPALNVVLTSLVMKAGIIAPLTGAALSNVIPSPIYLWMATNSFSGLIWGIIIIAIDVVVFYPFFKIAEKMAVKEETKEAAE